jgi:hypothetical protein
MPCGHPNSSERVGCGAVLRFEVQIRTGVGLVFFTGHEYAVHHEA